MSRPVKERGVPRLPHVTVTFRRLRHEPHHPDVAVPSAPRHAPEPLDSYAAVAAGSSSGTSPSSTLPLGMNLRAMTKAIARAIAIPWKTSLLASAKDIGTAEKTSPAFEPSDWPIALQDASPWETHSATASALSFETPLLESAFSKFDLFQVISSEPRIARPRLEPKLRTVWVIPVASP